MNLICIIIIDTQLSKCNEIKNKYFFLNLPSIKEIFPPHHVMSEILKARQEKQNKKLQISYKLQVIKTVTFKRLKVSQSFLTGKYSNIIILLGDLSLGKTKVIQLP